MQRDAGEPDPADTRIVQFHRQLAPADRDRLKTDYGLALTAYAGNLAYVERVDGPARQRLGRDPLVRAVAPYLPECKLDPLVVGAIQRHTAASEPLALLAWLFDGGSTEIVAGALAAASATDIHVHDDRPLGGLATVGFTADDTSIVERATTIDDVRWIELQPRISPNDVAASAMIQSGDASNASVWAKGIHGEGQVIGVIDTGVPDIAHCFLSDITPNEPGPSHRKLLAIRSVPGVFHPSVHPTVHATFVAGCAAGDHVDDPDFHPNRGSAWAAKLVCGTVAEVLSGSMLDELTKAKDADAFIHTNSWTDRNHPAGTGAPYSGIAVDTDTFCYQNETHLVLGSSGNGGEAQGAPGSAKNALCISAASADGTRVMDGNPGPTADGRRKPDLVAVGCGITSADSGTDCGMVEQPCATSWAAPHAAGAAALARQYFVEGWWRTGSKNPAHRLVPSAALLRAVLVSSAVDIPRPAFPMDDLTIPTHPNDVEGWGLIRLDRALTFADSARTFAFLDYPNRHGLRQGETIRKTHRVGGSAEQLKVVLAYTEPPGMIGTASASNTHLRLRVTGPNGVFYVGNDIDPTVGLSRADGWGNGDPLNNIEVVIVDAPPQGTWRIEVTAMAVHAADRQGYALVLTAGAASPRPGCFVAGAVYGNERHPDVVAIRRWRDRHLAGRPLQRWAMRALAAAYERVGPRAARAVTARPRLRAALRENVFPRLAKMTLDRPYDQP